MPRLTSNIPIPIGHAHCWERATLVALMRCRAARKDAQLELRAPSKDHDSNKTERALVEKRATVLAVPSRRTPKHVTETSQTSQTSKLAAPPTGTKEFPVARACWRAISCRAPAPVPGILLSHSRGALQSKTTGGNAGNTDNYLASSSRCPLNTVSGNCGKCGNSS